MTSLNGGTLNIVPLNRATVNASPLNEKRVGLGLELVTNGGFDTADDWALGAGGEWVISGGTANYDGLGNSVCRQTGFSVLNGWLYFEIIVDVGKTALLRVFDYAITKNYIQSENNIIFGDPAGVTQSGSGFTTNTYITSSQSVEVWGISGTGVCLGGYSAEDDFKIDNVSMKDQA